MTKSRSPYRSWVRRETKLMMVLCCCGSKSRGSQQLAFLYAYTQLNRSHQRSGKSPSRDTSAGGRQGQQSLEFDLAGRASDEYHKITWIRRPFVDGRIKIGKGALIQMDGDLLGFARTQFDSVKAFQFFRRPR